MSRVRRSETSERGAAIIWAILLMVVVTGLVGAFSMIASRSGERSADASRRVSNAATTNTAVTRVAYGLQNLLGSEADLYVLSRADLQAIARGASQVSVLRPAELPNIPASHVETFGVWERFEPSRGQLELRSVGALPNDTVVEEPVLMDAAACRAANLPQAACGSGSLRAYWQVVRVILPDTTGLATANATFTFRTWLGDRRTGAWSRASYATAELRPGRFADYQLISDGNVRFGTGASINGPVHSNGMADASDSVVFDDDLPPAWGSWMFGEANVRCTGKASVSITAGVIAGTLRQAACNNQGATGQSISFMRAIDSIEAIERADPLPNVAWFRATNHGPELSRAPYDTAWEVRLAGDTMHVWRPDRSRAPSQRLGRVSAFVFDKDVRISGRVNANTRVTVGARRRSGGSASIFIDGNLYKGRGEAGDRTSAIGLLAQGDIVLHQTPRQDCRVTTVQAAMVSATGGITVPPQYLSDELQTNVPSCRQTLNLDGSFASHRPPTLLREWDNGVKTGYAGTRRYTWDEQLKRTPPPYFPLTGTWQPFHVRDANADCLTTRKAEASCE